MNSIESTSAGEITQDAGKAGDAEDAGDLAPRAPRIAGVIGVTGALEAPEATGEAGDTGDSEDAGDVETPGWFPAVFLFGVVAFIFLFGGVWSWWPLLWAPLFVAAVGMATYEWRLVVRNRWRMPVEEWALFVIANAGCALSLAVVLGLLRL